MADHTTSPDYVREIPATERAVAAYSDEEFLQYMGAPPLTDDDVRALNAL